MIKDKFYKISFYSKDDELLFYGQSIKEILAKGFKNFNGQGKLYVDDAIYEEGIYSNGDLNGNGKKYKDKKLSEEGTYKDNELNGYGKRYMGNFILEEGEFKNDELNGYGKTYIRGELHDEGEFRNGKLNGQGKRWVNGYLFEQGEFRDGLLLDKIYKDDNDIEEKKLQQEVKCPKCNSIQIAPITKGFSLGKAAVGGMLFGGVGLLGGLIGSKDIKLVCLKCGHKWNL